MYDLRTVCVPEIGASIKVFVCQISVLMTYILYMMTDERSVCVSVIGVSVIL